MPADLLHICGYFELVKSTNGVGIINGFGRIWIYLILAMQETKLLAVIEVIEQVELEDIEEL